MKEIFVSEEAGYQKPRKEFFDYCFERIDKLNPERTMIIGDSLSSDIQGGDNAGIATCWLNLRNHSNNIGVKVDYEILQLKDLLNFL